MAATTGLAPALLGPLAPPPANTETATAATPSSVKTIQQLMSEIDEMKKEVETAVKKWEKLDTGRKKIAANRDEAIQGRTQIKNLKEHVVSLEKQLNAMTKEADPAPKLFDKTKKNAVKALSNLSHKLDQVDKHLEKATGTIPITSTPTADTQSATTPANVQPAAASTASTEGENRKGIKALISRSPFTRKKATSKESLNTPPPTVSTPTKPMDKTDDAARKTTKDEVASDDYEDEEGEEEGEEEEGSDDDDDVVSDKKKVSEKSPGLTKKPQPIIRDRKKPEVTNVESDGSDEEDDDDDVEDHKQLINELENRTLQDERSKDSNSDGRPSRTPTTPSISKKAPEIKTDSTVSSSPKSKKTTTIVPPLPPSRKKPPSPKRRTEVPATKHKDEESDEESYFEDEGEEEEDEEEEELRNLRDTGDHEEHESDHDYDGPEEEEEEPTIVNAHVQELRTNKYSPGTAFIVTHDLDGVQTGDLTIHKGEILTLVEQRPDDWWLFTNAQNQQGVAPINHIQLLSGQQPRRRIKPSTSAITLVDAFKSNNNIPAGFISSDLAPLTQLEDYQLWRALVPKMTESNLAFADLHWRVDTDKLHVQDVTYQKILTIKECVKIPRATGEQIRVLDRCVRVCLYDGFEIVSNIHTIRAHGPLKPDQRDLTENWSFVSNDINTLIDEQSELLIRSNRSNPGQHLNLLIELSQWCQSTVTQEKCEIACGWSLIPLEDDKPPLMTDTKSYNELLHGGHTAETNVLLDPQYKILRSDGLSGRIDRYKRARIKFSLESRETDVDLLYDNLPIQAIIVPINLIKTLAFFRNELAYQLHKRQHPTGLSTTPIDSLFLSTFFQTLAQPDLIYTLRRLFRLRRRRFLNSSSSSQQQREEFIKTYEIFIYPLLHYRQLPPYDFHDIISLNERRKLINDMVKRQLPSKKTKPQDILSILLDPNLTDKWTPFTTDEISFTLQKYIHEFTPDVIA